jgi:hypothetical protein
MSILLKETLFKNNYKNMPEYIPDSFYFYKFDKQKEWNQLTSDEKLNDAKCTNELFKLYYTNASVTICSVINLLNRYRPNHVCQLHPLMKIISISQFLHLKYQKNKYITNYIGLKPHLIELMQSHLKDETYILNTIKKFTVDEYDIAPTLLVEAFRLNYVDTAMVFLNYLDISDATIFRSNSILLSTACMHTSDVRLLAYIMACYPVTNRHIEQSRAFSVACAFNNIDAIYLLCCQYNTDDKLVCRSNLNVDYTSELIHAIKFKKEALIKCICDIFPVVFTLKILLLAKEYNCIF